MSDYIIQMKVSELKPHPINSTIYNDNPDAQKELIHSINLNGLLEPLVINRSNMVISGHRRLQALKEIGWEKCDCRLSEFENEIIALIQLNSYRLKVESEIVREAELLKTEYSKQIKKGRPLKGEVRDGKNWSIVNVSEKLGVSTTKLKKLISIKKHEPSLLEKVDLGLISVEQAYQKVRLKYIVGENDEKYNNSNFKSSFNQLLKRYNPTFDMVFELLMKHYPNEMESKS
jgi:ParB family transcriptional regulator, chromosome partitioning protein